jgi:hypothetical protein
MIPSFVDKMLQKKGHKERDIEMEELKDGVRMPKMYGKFHLGL